jgi:Holliday junction resolvase-like predicted endonuclease
MKVDIDKSSRHSKITGNFAENLVLYFLSKHGFECAYIDHTGIDIIARNPKSNELMGISVKSRSRNEGKEGQYVSVPNDNFDKIDNACKAFGCSPYFAFVVDEDNIIKVFIITKNHLLQLFPKGDTVVGWKMSDKWIKHYDDDPEIIKLYIDFKIKNWF